MPEDPRSDAELVRAINRGPPGAEAAFEALYRRHRDWALRVARRLGAAGVDPADLVQEAFITLLGQFPGFQLRAKLTTFLYPVLRNRALAAGRKRRALRLGGDAAEEQQRFAAGAGAGRDEGGEGVAPAYASLREAVEELPEAQREVLLMRLVDQMDVREVALALGVPEGTVKSRLHHALASLRGDPRAAAWLDEEK
ncbi:MAG: sigma-70 family RNA polymerase sigma factor [Phycisphaerales bacterium]